MKSYIKKESLIRKKMGRRIVFILLGIMLLLVIPMASAIESLVCVPSTDVINGGSITCEVDLADGTTEKNQPENMTFYNDSAQTIAITSCSFAGTSENSPNPQNLLHTCNIPSDWGTSTTAVVNFSLTDLSTSISVQFNISAITASDLIINDFVFETPIYLGELTGVRWTVTRADTGKAVLGAQCSGDILQLIGGNLVPIAGSTGGIFPIKSKHLGHALTSFTPNIAMLQEGTTYTVEVRCDCVPENTACMNEDGLSIVNSTSSTGLSGIGTSTFKTSTWLQTSVSTDLRTMNLKQMNTVSVNVTSNRTDERFGIDIIFDCRIDGNDNSTRRIKSPFFFPECNQVGFCEVERGIDAGKTQEQTTDFIVLEHPFLQGRNTEAYCSTEVQILSKDHRVITDYHDISIVFNITSDELNLEPDWQWVSDLTLNSIVNLSSSSFNDYNGTGRGNIDLRLDFHPEQLDLQHMFGLVNLIKNITIRNSSNFLIEHLDYEFEFLEDGNIELEIRNVSLSKYDGTAWWNITLDFYDLNLRQTEAFEDIANKTGTFHLEIDCPAEGVSRSTMDCFIKAKVEDSQMVEKEVDFTCFIVDGDKTYSTVNFNKMVTRTGFSEKKSFEVNNNLITRKQYVLQCYADYYNLGSRRDSFSDTFTVAPIGAWQPVFAGGLRDDFADAFRNLVGTVKEFKFTIVAFMILMAVCMNIFHVNRKKNKKKKD